MMNKIAVLMPYRNAKDFIVDAVNSVLTQQYSNYEIYLLDDQSDDGTLEQLDTDEYPNINKIYNPQRLGPLGNIYNGLIEIPFNDEDIIVWLDGDDYIFGDYAFQMVNQIYNEGHLISFGQYIDSFGRIGHCSPYSNEEFNNLRVAPWKASHLKTFKYKLFREFLNQDPEVRQFKFDDSSFFMASSDMAVMIPLLEIAGMEKSYCMQNVVYCYRLHPNNDHVNPVGRQMQLDAEHTIRNRPALKKAF